MKKIGSTTEFEVFEQTVGRKRINIIVRLRRRPYQYRLVGQLTGQRSAKLRFIREDG